eukprot:jgi/Mesen1/10904/ME000095S10248
MRKHRGTSCSTEGAANSGKPHSPGQELSPANAGSNKTGKKGGPKAGLQWAAGTAIAALAAMTTDPSKLALGVVMGILMFAPLTLVADLLNNAVKFLGGGLSLILLLGMQLRTFVSHIFLDPLRDRFLLLLSLVLNGPVLDYIFCFVLISNFLAALGGAFTRSRSAAAARLAGSRYLNRGQVAAWLLLDQQSPTLAPGIAAAGAAQPGAGGVPSGMPRVMWVAPTVVNLVPGFNGLAWLLALSESFPLLSARVRVAYIRNFFVYCAPLVTLLLASPVLEPSVETTAGTIRMHSCRGWTAGDVAKWLRESGLTRYAASFLEHNVSSDLLLRLDSEELREELGMTSLGDRKRFSLALKSVHVAG